MEKIIIAPSFLSADFLNLQTELDMINNSEADWIHLDVMDGCFVPNISFGFPIIEAVARKTQKLLDVHLMIVEPERYIERFVEAGAGIVTVHYEACTHLHRTISQIKAAGVKAGVALNPHTPVELLEEILQDVDLVLIMSVNPGFGGQKFIENSLAKVERLRRMVERKQTDLIIEVDGGIGLTNIDKLWKAGVRAFVAGSSIFKSGNPVETIENMKETIKKIG